MTALTHSLRFVVDVVVVLVAVSVLCGQTFDIKEVTLLANNGFQCDGRR